MRSLGAILAGAVLLTGAADAKPPLRDVAEIDGALFDLGVADRIRKNCPTISARMLRAISYVHDLEQRARALGYTSEEIDAYTDSDAEGNVVAEGSWAVGDGKTCFTPTTEGVEAMCFTESEPAEDGSFTATPDEGDPVTVRPAAAAAEDVAAE